MNICLDCRYYKDGRCRRHSPVYADLEFASEWPVVEPEDWCGDWEEE